MLADYGFRKTVFIIFDGSQRKGRKGDTNLVAMQPNRCFHRNRVGCNGYAGVLWADCGSGDRRGGISLLSASGFGKLVAVGPSGAGNPHPDPLPEGEGERIVKPQSPL